jgi:hypothetical protein
MAYDSESDRVVLFGGELERAGGLWAVTPGRMTLRPIGGRR